MGQIDSSKHPNTVSIDVPSLEGNGVHGIHTCIVYTDCNW